METRSDSFYRDWIGANALGEMFGLGLTFTIGFVILSRVGDPISSPGWLALLGVMTATGAVEGTIVGVAQWRVLRRRLDGIRQRAWVGATIAGALLAWLMGSLPSTLLQAGASQAGQTVPEPAAWMVLLLAAGLGAVAGLVLASIQALALRPHVLRAWLWLPANALAWAIGMPTIFLAIDPAQRAGRGPLVVVVMALGLVAAGAAVGAVHGWILVRLELKSAARGRP